MTPKLTVVVPTFNRAAFLGRMLACYRRAGCPYPLVVADSSAAGEREANASAIAEARAAGLEVSQRGYPPETDLRDKIADALAAVATPYVVMGADDDFFVMDGLAAAVRRLEERADVSVAHGTAAVFKMATADAAVGAIAEVRRYSQRGVEQDRPSARLLDHLGQYSTMWYSVQRTDGWRQRFGATRGRGLSGRFLELVPSALAVVDGKACKLEGLYMVRQDHPSSKDAIPASYLDWIIDERFAADYRRARALIAERLAAAEGTSEAQAARTVDEAFCAYLVWVLPRSFPIAAEGWPGRLRERLRRTPGVRTAWTIVRQRLDELSLPSLRAGRSPFAAAFAPIEQAVTGEGST